jgi:hypothetical protein
MNIAISGPGKIPDVIILQGFLYKKRVSVLVIQRPTPGIGAAVNPYSRLVTSGPPVKPSSPIALIIQDGCELPRADCVAETRVNLYTEFMASRIAAIAEYRIRPV